MHPQIAYYYITVTNGASTVELKWPENGNQVAADTSEHKLLACTMHCCFMQHHTRPGTPGYLVRSQKVHYGKAGVQDKRAPLKRQRVQGAKLKRIDSCRLPPKCNLREQMEERGDRKQDNAALTFP